MGQVHQNARSIVVVPAPCRPDAADVAERYVMGTLPEANAAVFEEHLLLCDACRAAVEQADVYVRAMRGTGREISESSASHFSPARSQMLLSPCPLCRQGIVA